MCEEVKAVWGHLPVDLQEYPPQSVVDNKLHWDFGGEIPWACMTTDNDHFQIVVPSWNLVETDEGADWECVMAGVNLEDLVKGYIESFLNGAQGEPEETEERKKVVSFFLKMTAMLVNG